MSATAPLTGVVLLNMGGPDSLDAIRPFLARLFLDEEVIRIPAGFATRPLFAWIASGLRARKVRRYYEEIGGASPIGALTEMQRAALEAALRDAGGNFRAYVGMRYWHPLAKHAALAMKEDGVSAAVALPLYPQYCAATTGSSLKDLRRWLRWAGAAFPLREVRSYPDHPGYVDALGDTLDAAFRGAPGDGRFLLFSAHGVPQSFIDRGDPYRDEVERTVSAVMRRFPGVSHGISYQSRLGPVRWLGPETAAEVARLGAAGVRTLVVVPVSFVSDHIETLHELDIRLRATAEAAGIRTFVRAPALNDSPAFIRALRDIVLAASREGS